MRSIITSQPGETIADGLLAMLNRPDSAAVLDHITVPTLIVVSDEDTVTPPSDADFMHRRVQGSTLVNIPSTGHMAHLESPDAFDDAVRSFLRRVV